MKKKPGNNELLEQVKENVSHQLKLDRNTLNISQKEAAARLEVSERTIQRIEDVKTKDCSFSSAYLTIQSLSKISEYSMKDWFIKVCCPDDNSEFRTQWAWEKDLLQKLNETNQSYRRIFSSSLNTCEDSETLELALILSALLIKSNNKKSLLSLILNVVSQGPIDDEKERIISMLVKKIQLYFKDNTD